MFSVQYNIFRLFKHNALKQQPNLKDISKIFPVYHGLSEIDLLLKLYSDHHFSDYNGTFDRPKIMLPKSFQINLQKMAQEHGFQNTLYNPINTDYKQLTKENPDIILISQPSFPSNQKLNTSDCNHLYEWLIKRPKNFLIVNGKNNLDFYKYLPKQIFVTNVSDNYELSFQKNWEKLNLPNLSQKSWTPPKTGYLSVFPEDSEVMLNKGYLTIPPIIFGSVSDCCIVSCLE